MRNIVFAVLLMGCSVNPHKPTVNYQGRIDSLQMNYQKRIDSLQERIDSLRTHKVDIVDFNNEYRIEQIKRYVLICDKSPKNKVFFFGWVKRALK